MAEMKTNMFNKSNNVKKEILKDENLTEAEVAPVRKLKGSKNVYHDLFKLKNAPMVKILGVPDPVLMKKAPHLVRTVQLEHCHIFHSIDSNGRPQKYSTHIGGHCHEIKVNLNPDGSFKVECGPPLRRFKNSRVEPVEPYDTHTHEVEYIESIELQARKANQEAVKYASSFQPAPLPRDL